MRKLAALCAACILFLSGCDAGNANLQSALSFRQRLLSAGGCSFTADVTADHGDTLCSFQLQCRYRDGVGEFTVTSPELLSGIRATCTGDASNIVFDGAVLELGDLSDGYIPPLSLPWLFGSAWEKDEITAASKDEESCRVTIQKGYEQEKIVIDTWLSDGIPIAGEVANADGRRDLSVQFRDFAFSDGKP